MIGWLKYFNSDPLKYDYKLNQVIYNEDYIQLERNIWTEITPRF